MELTVAQLVGVPRQLWNPKVNQMIPIKLQRPVCLQFILIVSSNVLLPGPSGHHPSGSSEALVCVSHTFHYMSLSIFVIYFMKMPYTMRRIVSVNGE
jgi:hypothetical protein